MMTYLFLQPSLACKVWNKISVVPLEVYVAIVLRRGFTKNPDFNRVDNPQLFPRDSFYGELYCGTHIFSFMSFDAECRVRLLPVFAPVIEYLSEDACMNLYNTFYKHVIKITAAGQNLLSPTDDTDDTERLKFFHTIFTNSISLTPLYKRGLQ